MDNANVRRELDKLADVVRLAHAYIGLRGEANAALHMASGIRHSPLKVALSNALDDLERLRAEFE